MAKHYTAKRGVPMGRHHIRGVPLPPEPYDSPLPEDMLQELRLRARLHRRNGVRATAAAHMAMRQFIADGGATLAEMQAGADKAMLRYDWTNRYSKSKRYNPGYTPPEKGFY